MEKLVGYHEMDEWEKNAKGLNQVLEDNVGRTGYPIHVGTPDYIVEQRRIQLLAALGRKSRHAYAIAVVSIVINGVNCLFQLIRLLA